MIRRPDREPCFRVAAFAALCVLLGAGAASADERGGSEEPCEWTAQLQAKACRAESWDDYYAAKATCSNQSDRRERMTCSVRALVEQREAEESCGEQLEAREELCEELGGGRYDPHFDAALFDDDFATPRATNPYFPLAIGSRWVLSDGGDETVTIRVLDATKLIAGVRCIVVNDRVTVGGVPHEDTDDWFGQRLDGTVDYCGESVRDFEVFEGDVPPEPELVDIAGSFKHGRDGALAGTQMPGAPVAGMIYRQEWALGEAEDAARVLSADYGYGDDADLDRFVPEELADLLCDDDCVVTEEFSPLEPDVVGRKYYARGIGFFLEVKPATGDTVQLVDCNLDARCTALPEP